MWSECGKRLSLRRTPASSVSSTQWAAVSTVSTAMTVPLQPSSLTTVTWNG